MESFTCVPLPMKPTNLQSGRQSMSEQKDKDCAADGSLAAQSEGGQQRHQPGENEPTAVIPGLADQTFAGKAPQADPGATVLLGGKPKASEAPTIAPAEPSRAETNQTLDYPSGEARAPAATLALEDRAPANRDEGSFEYDTGVKPGASAVKAVVPGYEL